MKNVIVIGANAAGLSAASQIKRLQPSYNINVFEATPYISYSRCSLFYYIEGAVKKEDLFIYSPDDFLKERGINVHIKSKVTKINKLKKYIEVSSPEGVKKYSFDYIVISTGASPVRIDGADFYLRTFEDAEKIKASISGFNSIAVIGGGYIGIKAAALFQKTGKKVYLIDRGGIAPGFCGEIKKFIRDILKAKSIKVYENCAVDNIKKVKGVSEIRTDFGKISADKVMAAAGVEPNVQFKDDLKLRNLKGYPVNENFQLNSYMYACGDCVSYKSSLTGKTKFVNSGTLANRSGRFVGEKIGGKKPLLFHTAYSEISEIFGIPFARTGVNEEEGKKLFGSKFDSVEISSYDKPPALGGKKGFYKLYFLKDTKLILGAELFNAPPKKIDIISALLLKKASAEDLYRTDFAYQPLWSAVWDPLQILAKQALK